MFKTFEQCRYGLWFILKDCFVEGKSRIHFENFGLDLYVFEDFLRYVFSELLDNPDFLCPHFTECGNICNTFVVVLADQIETGENKFAVEINVASVIRGKKLIAELGINS